MDLGEESVAEQLGWVERQLQVRETSGEANVEKVASEPRISHFVLSSTPVKLPEEGSRDSMSLGGASKGFPMKRASKVLFTLDEVCGDVVERVRSAKSSKSDLGNSSRTVMLAGGVTTEIGLSKIDAMVDNMLQRCKRARLYLLLER